MGQPEFFEDSLKTFQNLLASDKAHWAFLIAADLVKEQTRKLLFLLRRQEGWLTKQEKAEQRVEFRCCFTGSFVNRLDLWKDMIKELRNRGMILEETSKELIFLEERRSNLLRGTEPIASFSDPEAQSAWDLLEQLYACVNETVDETRD